MPRARREAGHAKQSQTMGSQDTEGGGSTCCSLLWDEVGVGLEGGLAGGGVQLCTRPRKFFLHIPDGTPRGPPRGKGWEGDLSGPGGVGAHT